MPPTKAVTSWRRTEASQRRGEREDGKAFGGIGGGGGGIAEDELRSGMKPFGRQNALPVEGR